MNMNILNNVVKPNKFGTSDNTSNHHPQNTVRVNVLAREKKIGNLSAL
jgi:hypothetical protein